LELDFENHCFKKSLDVHFNTGIKKVYYKFIVDEEWLTSDNDKTEIDESGNLNNVIVLSIDKNKDGNESVVLVRDSDGESAFTSISYPNEEQSNPEVNQLEKSETYEPYEEEDLVASVQITLADSSSVTGSIQSNQLSVQKIKNIKQSSISNTFIGRIRNIFQG
jgi:hypothetical protein